MTTAPTARPPEATDTRYTQPTQLVDYDHPSLRALIAERGWTELPERERIGAIYYFVRDEIRFGYNASDDLPASSVLADGYGQCDTKATLLMTLLRATGISCRLHGATVDKRLQRGMVSELVFRLWRADIRHSWVEVLFEGSWVGLDGAILDRAYLDGVRAKVRVTEGEGLLGYAVGTDDLAHPPIEWQGADTAIQTTAVVRDLGIFDDPDTFYRGVGSNFSGIRGWIFRHLIRPSMNEKVAAIRALAGTERSDRS
jgi:transglutaminase-like putative cysteine protease